MEIWNRMRNSAVVLKMLQCTFVWVPYLKLFAGIGFPMVYHDLLTFIPVYTGRGLNTGTLGFRADFRTKYREILSFLKVERVKGKICQKSAKTIQLPNLVGWYIIPWEKKSGCMQWKIAIDSWFFACKIIKNPNN